MPPLNCFNNAQKAVFCLEVVNKDVFVGKDMLSLDKMLKIALNFTNFCWNFP